MNPDITEGNRLLNENHTLKKNFYKYLDMLTSANLTKCNLKFLKSCLEDQIIPKSLLPRNIKIKRSPFPQICRSLLKYHIEETKHLVDKSFFLTKTKFKVFQSCFYNISQNLNILTAFIDKAHTMMNIKINQRKNFHKQKLENLFEKSEWVKKSNHSIIKNIRLRIKHHRENHIRIRPILLYKESRPLD